MYLIFLGLPGAGKGTQASVISQETGLAHITTGELFRENVRNDTELGREVKPYLDQGLLVPNDLTINMLLDRIARPDAAKGFVLDGFPRNLAQARALDESLRAKGKAIDKTIYIEVSTEELVRRLAGRWNCPQCGAVYHEQSSPPKNTGACDRCGAELYQREDDKPEVVRTRLEVNMKELRPLLDYYRDEGKLSAVDGEQDVDVVKNALRAIMAPPQEVR